MTKTGTNLIVKPTITGFFDYIQDGCAYGWAFNPSRPGERVSVEILCGKDVVGRGIAKNHRVDLSAAGIGDGNYSFQIQLSYELHNNQVHTLIARDESTQTILEGSPKPFPATKTENKFELIGRIEGMQLFTALLNNESLNIKANQKGNLQKVYQLGAVLQETESLVDARFAWDALGTILENPALLSCKIAETFMLEAQYESALQHYKIAAGSDIKFIWSHLGISAAYRHLGNHQQAQHAVEVAMALQPENSTARKYLIEIKTLLNPVAIDDGNDYSNFYHLANLLVPYKQRLANPCTLRKSEERTMTEDISSISPSSLDTFQRMVDALKELVDTLDTPRIKKTS